MELSVHAPRDNEWPICRMLLPETFDNASIRRYRLATLDGRIAAAASYTETPEGIANLRVHVVPSHRRRGVGSRLIEHLAGLTRGSLSGTAELTRETAAAAFCERNRFERAGALITSEADIAEFRESISRLRERILRSRQVVCVPVSEAPAEEVARLHAEHVASGQTGLNAWRALVTGSPGMSRSTVAMVEGRVAGILLWEIENGIVVVRSRVVVPGYHGSSINALMLAQALDEVWAAGARSTRFCYTDSNLDTAKLARRMRAGIVSVIARFVRAA